MIANKLIFSFKTKRNNFAEGKCFIDSDRMYLGLDGIEDYWGSFELKKPMDTCY